jgi:hypothetical protein
MKHYIVAHWRGEQSLARSFLVNGLLGFIVVPLVFVALGYVIRAEAFVYVGFCLILVWLVWAAVGIVRCAIAIFRRPSSLLLRFAAALVMILTAVALYGLTEGLTGDIRALWKAFFR